MNQEAMKNQTIGVEVEMNRITRKDAATVVANLFGTPSSVNYDGGVYDTWSCRDAQGRKWKMQHDSSIHGPWEYRCELVTPILVYSDIELLQEVVRALRRAGAKSDPSRGCGVHIHIGANGHTAQTLRNLTNIMASHEMLLASALKIVDPDRIGRYCKPVDPNFLREVNLKKPTTMEALADVWYESQYCSYHRNDHYNSSRYHMLNLHAVFTKGTVEFRLFQFDLPTDDRKGGLHAGQLKSYIQLCLALSQAAKEARNASPKQPQTENPKYAMRTWLLRLGFIGDEFATARNFLTRNLEGDAAFRMPRAS